MLKAGKTFKAQARIFKNENSIIVAPQIHIHGLVLDASKPISGKIQDFLQSKGVVVQQIEEDGDTLLRMSGVFEVSQSEVQDFLTKNQDTQLPVVDEKQILEAENFQRQVSTSLKNKLFFSKQKVSVSFDFYREEDDCGVKVSPAHAGAGTVMSVKCAEGPVGLQGDFFGVAKVEMSAGTAFRIEGNAIRDLSVTMLSTITSGGDINIKSKRNCDIKDALLCATKDIELISHQGDIAKKPALPL